MYQGHPIIALCMVRADDERNFTFIEALSRKIHAIDGRLIVYQSTSDMFWKSKPEEGEKVIFGMVDYSIVDLVIVFSEIINDEQLIDSIIQDARSHGKPVFSIGKEKPGCTFFGFLYEDGIEKAIRHVVEEHRCRELCFVAGPEGEATSERRLAKYREIVTEYGLDTSVDRVYYGGYWSRPAMQAAREILKLNPLPEAIVCANDLMAITIIDVFKESGIRVPEDVIITGLDAIWEALVNVPTITTSGCDMDEMADSIVSAFCKLRKGGILHPKYYSKFNMILAESCGCHKSSDNNRLVDFLKSTIEKQNRKAHIERSFHSIYEGILRAPNAKRIPEILDPLGFESLDLLANADAFQSEINPISDNYRIGFDDKIKVIYQAGRDNSHLPITIPRSKVDPNYGEMLLEKKPIILSPLSFFSRAVGYLVYQPEVTSENYFVLMAYTNFLSEIIGSYSMVRHLEYNAEIMDRMARHDYLTDLYNRTGFYAKLPQLYEQYPTPFYAVTTVDMDGLKRINDEYGHEAGDLAIQHVASASINACGKNAICGRFGGDEFVICSAIRESSEIDLLRERIFGYLSEKNAQNDLPCEITVSIGTCIMPAEDFEFDSAFKKSDELMYQEKSGKKNRRHDLT